jgi:hypothetical protein
VYNMISQKANYSDDLLVDAATSAAAQHATGFITAYEANEDPSDPPGDLPNLFTNPSFETSTNGSPKGWETNTWGGSAEFSHVSSTARNGEHSVQISSTEGADASWTQVVDVEPNAEYTFSAYVKTGENFEPTTGFGVTLNVHELGQDSLANVVTESNTDWTKLETTISTGNSEQLTFNCLYGGWGDSVGSVWFDDAELVQSGGFGGALETVYRRVKEHVEQGDGGNGDGDNGEDGGDNDTIDPGTTIEVDGVVGGWKGVSPSGIEGKTNPTLSLEAGEEYTVEWTNADGVPHDFVIQDSERNEIVGTEIVLEKGVTTPLMFTASSEMARYICTVHPSTMVGDIEVS